MIFIKSLETAPEIAYYYNTYKIKRLSNYTSFYIYSLDYINKRIWLKASKNLENSFMFQQKKKADSVEFLSFMFHYKVFK